VQDSGFGHGVVRKAEMRDGWKERAHVEPGQGPRAALV
jgi:hypothetical protein